MDGEGSPAPDGSRLHVDDAIYSPSRSPPLLQSLSGNDSSSGSPSGSRRHGSTGEKDKKNRDERLKLMKERNEQQHERRLADLKAAYEKETRIRQLKEAERLRRIQEIKMKEAQRRQGVEERRRRLESEDKEKREQILAKYKEYEHRLISQRDLKKPVYAFGSSTPRTLAYLEHLDNSMRVYNSRLGSATGADDESANASKAGASSAEKRATSACSLTRKPLTATSSPNLSPLHQQHQRAKHISSHHPPPSKKTVLAPSGRWGGSMVASMYGGSAALSAATAHGGGGAHTERDPLVNVHSMTTSFAVGESSVSPHVKNVRTKGPLSPASARSQSTPRLARTPTTTTRKTRQDIIEEETEDGTDMLKNNTENQKGVSKRNGSDGSGEGAANAAGHSQKAKGVSSTRTPSAPPPASRRPVGDTVSKNVAASKPAPTKEKTKTGVASKALPQKGGESDNVKIIRKPKSVSETSTPDRTGLASPTINNDVRAEIENGSRSPSAEIVPDVSINVVDQSIDLFGEEMAVDVDSIRLDNDNLCQYEQPIIVETSPQREQEQFEEPDNRGDGISAPKESVSIDQNLSVNQEIDLLTSSMENLDMSASTIELISNVPKPSGQGAGKVLSKEEATAALAERRRLAREQIEREKELERQREEQRLLEEEEMRRREEEEFRRQEEEELRMLEEAKRLEQERMRKMIEEEDKRREDEAKLHEEEQRKKAEFEAKAREEAERAERERKEAEEKFKKDELERSERKKRLEAIMQRTRQSGAAGGPSTTPINKQQQQGGSGQLFVNGGNEHGNDSIYSTPDTLNASLNQTSAASSSVLKKIANVRPEVGRSLENILNRVKSTPNVSDVEHAADSSETSMTTSFSADKVSQSPANGDARLTQSFYATPAADNSFGKSFNHSGASEDYARTEYDIEAEAVRSQSHYARVLFNEDETDSATAALASIPGVDSNANQNRNRSNILTDYFDHNDNMNGAESTAPNGHGGERASASDSDASSAVTVINQKVSPHDLSLEDAFSSPTRVHSTYDDLINDNLTPDGQTKKVQSTTSHQERPLMDF